MALAHRITTGGFLALGHNAIRLYELDQQHDNATFAGSINRGTTRIHSLDFSHQGQYIYWTEMGIVQMVAQLGQPPLQLSYPRLKRAAVADLGTVESFPDPVQGGDVRRANDGTMILVGKQQNLIYSIAYPDAATPTVLDEAQLNARGYTFVLHPNMALQPLVITKDSPVKQRAIGEKHYELSDHLGNVRVVLSDIKMGDWNSTTTTISDYRPELISRADYYAFGSLLPGRNYSSDAYRWGFNGAEKDEELHVGPGTSYDFGARLYDPRIGRWLSLNAEAQRGPALSPYSFAFNSRIMTYDPDGNWGEVTITRFYKKNDQLIAKSTFRDIFRKTVKIQKDIVIHNAKLYVDPGMGSVDKVTISSRIQESITNMWNGTHPSGKNNNAPVVVINLSFADDITPVTSLDEVHTEGPNSDDLWVYTSPDVVSKFTAGHASATVVGKNITLLSLASFVHKNTPGHEFGHKGDLPDNPQGEVMDNDLDIGKPNYWEARGLFGDTQGKNNWGDNIKKSVTRIKSVIKKSNGN